MYKAFYQKTKWTKKAYTLIGIWQKKTIPFPSNIWIYTHGLVKSSIAVIFFMGKETNGIRKWKRTTNMDMSICTTIEHTLPGFGCNSMFESGTQNKNTVPLCSITLQLVGGTMCLTYVVIPRRIHWRELVFIGFQGQSKIRQLWCCLHNSALKIFQNHSTLNYFPASFQQLPLGIE